LAELAKLDGLHWMRILYAYPSYFSEELIDEIANNDKVCKYIDIPLQHMSNLALLAMNRPPRGHTETLLRTLRARIPRLALRTTFISGFPGETDAQHHELVEFCRDFKFERMGAFVYSEEEGTSAAGLPDQVRASRARRGGTALDRCVAALFNCAAPCRALGVHCLLRVRVLAESPCPFSVSITVSNARPVCRLMQS
jgi:ribosomal protein S12 methylthiotransferase